MEAVHWGQRDQTFGQKNRPIESKNWHM
jgi:hypothetical protein